MINSKQEDDDNKLWVLYNPTIRPTTLILQVFCVRKFFGTVGLGVLVPCSCPLPQLHC
jgi:hypothetical protein